MPLITPLPETFHLQVKYERVTANLLLETGHIYFKVVNDE